MRSRARAMGQGFRLLAPVRGLIRPSIPLPFHWRPETRSQTSSPRVMNFFSLLFIIRLIMNVELEMCSLLIDKARIKNKTYILIDEMFASVMGEYVLLK